MTTPTLGCAVRRDGTLKDPSEIIWHFDKDDDNPMTAPGSGADSLTSDSSPQIHPFFSGCVKPATFVAGSRRSGRATRPSNRLADPDNVAGSSSARNSKVIGKRKALNCDPSTRLVIQKIHTSASDDKSESDNESEDHTPARPMREESTDVDEPKDAAGKLQYAVLQAMADADHEVSTAF